MRAGEPLAGGTSGVGGLLGQLRWEAWRNDSHEMLGL